MTNAVSDRDDATLVRGTAVSRQRDRLVLTCSAGIVAAILSLAGIEAVFRILDIPFEETWVPSETALAQFDPALGEI